MLLGGVWCWCGAAAHSAWSVTVCGWGRPRRRPPRRRASPTQFFLADCAGCQLSGIMLDVICWVERAVWEGGVLPLISIGADVWVESSIMTGVYECWCSSTLHIGCGLCDSLCLVLLCVGRYCLGVEVLLFILGSSLGGLVRGLRGGGRGGWCEEQGRIG